MKKEDIGPLVRTAVETGLTVSGHPIAAKVAGPGLTRFMGVAADWFEGRNRQKFEAWLHEIAATNEHASAEETIRQVEDHIDERWAHGPLEDAVRAIRDGIDEAALPYLAKLAALQIRDKVPPDRWSRRAVGLLLNCDSQMVEALVHLTEHLPSHWPGDDRTIVRIAIGGPNALSFEEVQISPMGIATSTPRHEKTWRPHPLYPELFALLRAHQFATEESGRFAHEGKVLMRRSEAIYLVRLL